METNWIKVRGENKPQLEKDLTDKVKALISEGEFSKEDVKYIDKLDLCLTKGSLDLTNKQLENLRRLCQLWDVEIRTVDISSHRKFIGPVIVAVKRLVYPLIKFFLKDFIRQQRAFNAASIATLSELSNQRKK